MAIEALLFDLGKVIIDFDFERGVSRFAASSPLTREEFNRRAFDHNWIRRYERGEISTADYHQYLRDHAGLGLTLKEFHEAWSSVFLPDLILPEEFFRRLRKRYPLVLVSNTNEVHVDYISRSYQILEHFHHRIFSHVVGSLKPDRKIYEAAIAASGKSPESLFFTDDRQENIEAAREMGLNTHLFRTPGGLAAALREHKVDVGDFVLA